MSDNVTPGKASLRAIKSHLPAGRLTNEMLAREFEDWDLEKISRKTGIYERGLVTDDECASDLGVTAAQRLFDAGLCQPRDIDFLLLCTQSPDYFLPSSACIMQDRLGLPTSCGAFDFNLGCSGFVYGLSLAKGLIETGQAANVLLVTAETYSKFIRPENRSVRAVFSDGASAALVSSSDNGLLGPFLFGTDGKGAPNLIVSSGGMRNPGRDQPAKLELLMDGPEIFQWALQAVPAVVNGVLAKAGITAEQVDYYVFHQANRYMLEALRRKLRIPSEKFCVNLEQYGNTVSATIPMALELALERGDVKAGDRVMLVGFGVGYSWAGALIELPG